MSNVEVISRVNEKKNINEKVWENKNEIYWTCNQAQTILGKYFGREDTWKEKERKAEENIYNGRDH